MCNIDLKLIIKKKNPKNYNNKIIKKIKTVLTTDNVNIRKIRLGDRGVTGSDGAVAKSLTNALIVTRFASRYRLQSRACL